MSESVRILLLSLVLPLALAALGRLSRIRSLPGRRRLSSRVKSSGAALRRGQCTLVFKRS